MVHRCGPVRYLLYTCRTLSIRAQTVLNLPYTHKPCPRPTNTDSCTPSVHCSLPWYFGTFRTVWYSLVKPSLNRCVSLMARSRHRQTDCRTPLWIGVIPATLVYSGQCCTKPSVIPVFYSWLRAVRSMLDPWYTVGHCSIPYSYGQSVQYRPYP